MTRLSYNLFHSANALVCATGLIYAWMRYLLQPVDEWAIVNHPWQSHLQHAHILVAPLLVCALGYMLTQHAIAAWRSPEQRGRWSGIALVVLTAPMIMSGYLLQTAVHEQWRDIWIVLHVVTSLAWIACTATHTVRHLIARR